MPELLVSDAQHIVRVTDGLGQLCGLIIILLAVALAVLVLSFLGEIKVWRRLFGLLADCKLNWWRSTK